MKDEYLIKSKDKTLCYFGIGYISYVYEDKTWASTVPRKRAKVFTKQEALALLPRWHTFRMVKK